MTGDRLTGEEVASEGLGDWVHLVGRLHARFRLGDFAAALALVDDIGAAAEEMDHHPDLELRWGQVDVALSSHDVGGVTRRDVRLARRVSELAAQHGATAVPAEVSVLELALDTHDHEEVLPFWEAVLGYARDGDDEVRDPRGARPTVWFQQSERDESLPSQRWHLDLWIAPEQVRPRLEAALAAGGELVSDAEAPSYWILADPQGNKVCLCTWQERG